MLPWYVATLLGVALTMGLEFAHLLELGPKIGYPPELYLQVNLSLYQWFGGPVGGGRYIGGIVATGVLVWLLRAGADRRRVGAALAAQAAALLVWLMVVEPVNVRFRELGVGEIPPDFAALRARWEYGHAAGFVLFAAAFLLLVTLPSRRTPAGSN